MTPRDERFDRERCARGFIRAAQYLANMLAGADVLAESRQLIGSIFAPDVLCFLSRSGASDDGALPAAGRGILQRAAAQVIDTGLMAIERIDAPEPIACVLLPVSARGRVEATLLVGYRGIEDVPAHALEALLGVAGIVGATLARQRADRELLALAEERAARAIAEVTERRARLLAEASKALFASFDTEAALAALAGLVVPHLADWCAVELRDGGRNRQVALVDVDPARAEPAREELARARPPLVVPFTVHGEVFGAMKLGVTERVHSPDDLSLAEEIGRRAGTALENARLYRRARNAIAVRDQFLAIASHELKTPLAGLLLVLQGVERTLAQMPNPPPRMRAKVAVITRQGQRLNQLVANLLDVSRIEAGRLHIALEQVDLAAVVRHVVERHELEALQAGSPVEVIAPEPVIGLWDASGVDQVVSNLLSNAIKYGAGEPVTVTAEARGDTARLTFTDRGSGIAPGDQERIFERFERAVADSGISGMGLGLWISREIVTRLGGSIRVESTVGAGSRFVVELPVRPPAGAGEATGV